MFKTTLIEERTGLPWGIIAGLVAFVALLGTGYFPDHLIQQKVECAWVLALGSAILSGLAAAPNWLSH